jgi:hypothetical protein
MIENGLRMKVMQIAHLNVDVLILKGGRPFITARTGCEIKYTGDKAKQNTLRSPRNFIHPQWSGSRIQKLLIVRLPGFMNICQLYRGIKKKD